MARRITTKRKRDEDEEGRKRINTDWLAEIALLCKLPADDVRRLPEPVAPFALGAEKDRVCTGRTRGGPQ